MTKYILAADATLMTEYRHIPLATFFSCIPSDYWYSRLVHGLLADPPKLDMNGRPIRVPYGLRKIEAGLAKSVGRENVEIVDPRFIADHITEDTEVVGLHSMDPLGLGPVSMSFTLGGSLTPYTKHMFFDLTKRIQMRDGKFKVALGGPGAWQFEHRPGLQEQLGIDHIVQGEVDHTIGGIFEKIARGDAPPAMRFENGTAPGIDEIPKILGPTILNMVEVMRGCGRGCDFCEVTRRRLRYFPLDYIADEVAVNTAVPGGASIQLHADDIFVYKLEDRRTFQPNRDALKELFQHVMDQPGVRHCYPTHGTVSAAVADPDLIRDISGIVGARSKNWIGIQCGAETGSPKLAGAVLNRKAAPFSADEWPEIVIRGTDIFNKNHWFPAFTFIMGLPGEEPDDAWMTVDLLDRMDQIPNSHFIVAPLTFVPVGAMRGAEFFDIDTSIDEARFNVAYRAWQHNVSEIRKDLWQLMDMPLPMRSIVAVVARFGGGYILHLLERYANRRGFRIRKPATTAREAEGHVIRPHASTR
jgi:radical SAM superfamily enzyme YgiQ (UPF0313 family)